MASIFKKENLIQFEKAIIVCLVTKFSQYLPEEKINLLNNSSVITDELANIEDVNMVRGNIIRLLLEKVIDVRCEKELSIDDINVEKIMYGDYLEKGLIEYYAREISKNYHFDIDERPELKENLDTVIKLKERFDNGLDSKIFISNAIEILDEAGLNDLIVKCDNDAINKYIEKQEIVSNLNAGSAKEEEIIKETLENQEKNSGRISIVYLHGKQYVKYIDKLDEVHLVETDSAIILSDLFKKEISSLKPNEEINAEKFFNKIIEIKDEEDLKKPEDIDKKYLTHEEIDMLDFIYSNKDINAINSLSEIKKDSITINTEKGITVNELTNDIITIDSSDDIKRDATIVKDSENHNTVSTSDQESDIIQEDKLDEKEYNELCKKFASGEELTLDELRKMKNYTVEHSDKLTNIEEKVDEIELESDEKVLENNGPTLALKNAAFTNKYLLVFIIILTICFGIIFGTLLFNLTH